ncbi:MAG: elongation factor Ts [Rhodospirillaceae bacterium]|nr:elongation factor Ts [Rhodospirillaceae bacterium]
MAEITAAAVKELREKSGAGMMDCKTALTENDGDLEAAVDWLRKKGLSAADKKAGRAAAEGLVGMAVDGKNGALVEVNAETDFVARNEIFQDFVGKVTRLALAHGDDEAGLKAASVDGGASVEDSVVDLVATIGENIGFRRSTGLSVENGAVAGYVHNQVAPGLGKIGVLVALESTGDAAKLNELGRHLAMHVAAAQPQFLDVASVDAGVLEREREVLSEQARVSGKPEEIVEKMVEGRLRKFYEEVVLSEQTYVVDGETKVSKVIEAATQEIGAPVTLSGFVCFTLGEGIERREEDFADEVAKLAN